MPSTTASLQTIDRIMDLLLINGEASTLKKFTIHFDPNSPVRQRYGSKNADIEVENNNSRATVGFLFRRDTEIFECKDAAVIQSFVDWVTGKPMLNADCSLTMSMDGNQASEFYIVKVNTKDIYMKFTRC
jgi:hypothetical protein